MDDKNSKKKNKDAEPDSAINKATRGVNGWFKNIIGEFRKIVWPDKKALVKHTVNTVVTTAIVGAVIVGLDFLFSNGYSLFIKLGQ